MDFKTASWRKLYLPESLDHQAMPFFARTFRDFLIRAANDDGTLLARTEDPGPDLARALRVGVTEAVTVADFVAILLADGYLSHKKNRLFITRFEVAQERHGPMSPAERQRKRRGNLPKKQPQARDTARDSERDASHGMSQGEIDPKDRSEREREVERDNTRDKVTTPTPSQLTLDNPEPPKPKKRSTTLKGETRDQIAWRCWRELWRDRYSADYPSARPDGKAMKALAEAAENHARSKVTDTSDHEGRRAMTESVCRHWMSNYLADRGHNDWLVNNRHPLRTLDRGLAKYGLPWSTASAGPETESDRPELKKLG